MVRAGVRLVSWRALRDGWYLHCPELSEEPLVAMASNKPFDTDARVLQCAPCTRLPLADQLQR